MNPLLVKALEPGPARGEAEVGPWKLGEGEASFSLLVTPNCTGSAMYGDGFTFFWPKEVGSGAFFAVDASLLYG